MISVVLVAPDPTLPLALAVPLPALLKFEDAILDKEHWTKSIRQDALAQI